MTLDSYLPHDEAVNQDFRKIAETYFQNYIIDWCDQNKVDDASREYIIKVLSDYSVFFFDSLMHNLADAEPVDPDLKN
jgi:hypothetical protein